MASKELGKFLENKTAVLTFSCGFCGVRTVASKKITPNSVIVVDRKYGTINENEKTYELEIRPFPIDQKELAEYLLKGHAQMFHGTDNTSISDLRN